MGSILSQLSIDGNGVLGAKSIHMRVLWQGDLISRILFVLGIEVFSVMVTRAVEENLFTNLVGVAPLQCISVYADDVVLFISPAEEELRTVRSLLEMFGEASGLRVYYRKTTARGDSVDEDSKIDPQMQIGHIPSKILLLDKALQFIPAWRGA